MKSITFTMLYNKLLKRYGAQGWWPVRTMADTPGFEAGGYHPGEFSFPRTKTQLFEIITGAILTQNTAWINVEKALISMQESGLLGPDAIINTPQEKLAEIIRSSGYHNQKAKKLKIVAGFFNTDTISDSNKIPERDQLLGLWGIGPETADSILLYGFHVPVFVVDAYTRRLLTRLGLINESASYAGIQSIFHRKVKPSAEIYNEFHALIVCHAKEHCMKKPVCTGCPLLKNCMYVQD